MEILSDEDVAIAAYKEEQGLPFGSALSDEDVAIAAYEEEQELPSGSASLDQVAATSAGVLGYANSQLGKRIRAELNAIAQTEKMSLLDQDVAIAAFEEEQGLPSGSALLDQDVAIAAFEEEQGLPSGSALSDQDVAIAAYKEEQELPSGSASLDQVAATSAGVLGYANSDPDEALQDFKNLADKITEDLLREKHLSSIKKHTGHQDVEFACYAQDYFPCWLKNQKAAEKNINKKLGDKNILLIDASLDVNSFEFFVFVLTQYTKFHHIFYYEKKSVENSEKTARPLFFAIFKDDVCKRLDADDEFVCHIQMLAVAYLTDQNIAENIQKHDVARKWFKAYLPEKRPREFRKLMFKQRDVVLKIIQNSALKKNSLEEEGKD